MLWKLHIYFNLIVRDDLQIPSSPYFPVYAQGGQGPPPMVLEEKTRELNLRDEADVETHACAISAIYAEIRKPSGLIRYKLGQGLHRSEKEGGVVEQARDGGIFWKSHVAYGAPMRKVEWSTGRFLPWPVQLGGSDWDNGFGWRFGFWAVWTSEASTRMNGLFFWKKKKVLIQLPASSQSESLVNFILNNEKVSTGFFNCVL